MSLAERAAQLADTILLQCRKERSYFENSKEDGEFNVDENKLDARNRLRKMKYVVDITEYARLNKISALQCFQEFKEVEGISHLVESHAVGLRQQIIYNYSKSKIKEKFLKNDYNNMDIKYVNFDLNEDVWNGNSLKFKLNELPEEWYILQVTIKYEPFDYKYTPLNLPLSQHVRKTESIHLSVLPTGKDAHDPIVVTLPKPKNCENYDIMKEIGTVLYYLKSDLKRHYKNGMLYWSTREKQNDKMKNAMDELESSWLKEWRILLMADFAEDSKLITSILIKLNKIIRGYSKYKEITSRQKWLLKKVTLGASYLSKIEIAKAVKYILLNHIELAIQVAKFLCENMEKLEKLKDVKRKNLVLIIDENLDHIPFEMTKILKNQPVTRMPCLSIAYTLFKEYKDTIKDGLKVIEVTENLGMFIVNPAGDLIGTEKRLKVFNDYWLSNWQGFYGKLTDKKILEKALLDYNILMYNGHGNGMEYLSSEQIEKNKVKACALLFGCSSGSLKPVGGYYPPNGISNYYLMGQSPCILGMLWVVTDTDIDILTVNFLSRWIQSSAKLPWSQIDRSSWINGKLVFKDSNEDNLQSNEPEILRAVASARWVCKQYMTSASVVVRGLPIKLIYK